MEGGEEISKVGRRLTVEVGRKVGDHELNLQKSGLDNFRTAAVSSVRLQGRCD